MTANKFATAKQFDLFAPVLNDPNFRDQQETMERPFFALSKSRKTPITYVSPKGDITLQISPNATYGMATIWDLDILIWASSQINLMMERGEKGRLAKLANDRTLYFQPADLLTAIERKTGGKDREDLRAALDRLASTYIKTNIRSMHQGSQREKGFSWLDSWDEESDTRTGQSKGMSITLSNWFYMGVINQRMVLAIDSDYFSLKGGIERWLYRIARKHAHGRVEGFSFTLSTLHEKSGSHQRKSDFKRDLKKVIKKGSVLGYGFDWQERGKGEDPLLRIYPLSENERNILLSEVHDKTRRKKEADAMLLADPTRFDELANPRSIAALKKQFPNEDLVDLFSEFVIWNKNKGVVPRKIFPAFRGFIIEHKRRRSY